MFSTGDINIAPFNKSSYQSVYAAFHVDFLSKQQTSYPEKFVNKFIEFHKTTKLVNTCNGVRVNFRLFCFI